MQIEYKGVLYPVEWTSPIIENGELQYVTFTDGDGKFHTAFNQDLYTHEPIGHNDDELLHLSFKDSLKGEVKYIAP